MTAIRPIDGDGHIIELAEQLQEYLDPSVNDDGARGYGYFPALDGWPRGVLASRGGHPQDVPDGDGWAKFMHDLDFAAAVVYPSAGLGVAWIRDVGWAREVTRAYNDFTYDRFLKNQPNLYAVALLPVQDPEAAAVELRRAVQDLGMVGGMLAANGLRTPYGDSRFDPLYAEAESLGVMLGLHGAPQTGLGFDFFEEFKPGSVLAHPFSQMIQFTSMWFGGTFARFPSLKLAFLEAGSGWVPYLAERISHKAGQDVAEVIRTQPLYFHLEIDEEATIESSLAMVGADRLIYASDYPHDRAPEVKEDLDAFLAREDLDDAVKQAVLHDNSKALYGLDVA